MDRYVGRYVTILSQVSGLVPLTMCQDCGCPVIDRDKHDEYHDRTEHAIRNASYLDKIG